MTLFPSQLVIPVVKLIQDVEKEPNPLTRRLNHLVELSDSKEQVT